MDDAILEEMVRRARAGEAFAVGLLAHVQGSAPQKAGARLLVLPDGTMRGTVGGGCLEMETRRRALTALRTGEPDLFELRLDDDFGWDDGLICGGRTTLLVSPRPAGMADAAEAALAERAAGRRSLVATVLAAPTGSSGAVGAAVRLPEAGGSAAPLPFPLTTPQGPKPELVEQDGWRVLVETVRPAPTLVVMGCGHIGAALVELAAGVGFRVIAVDDRADYARADRLPGAAEVHCADMLEAARTLPSGPDTYWVIVTRGHRNDGTVLAQVINREFGYLGMIGSRRKVRLIREGILKEGIADAERLARLHSPVGLDIGAESPREIALSIAAELVAVRRGKAA
jgi:Xanthine and CO dehydrogenases maturation factor, XdhC/CoxF family